MREEPSGTVLTLPPGDTHPGPTYRQFRYLHASTHGSAAPRRGAAAHTKTGAAYVGNRTQPLG